MSKYRIKNSLDENFSIVLNEYLNEQKLINEDMDEGLGDYTKNLYNTAKNNFNMYKVEKEKGTGNHRMNPIGTSLLNGLTRVADYGLYGKRVNSDLRGGVFDKNTNGEKHQTLQNQIVAKLKNMIQLMLTDAAIAWSITQECLPAKFSLVKMKRENSWEKVFQLRMPNYDNYQKTADAEESQTSYKSQGYIQTHEIINWFNDPKQPIFRFGYDVQIPKNLQNYEWLYKECDKILQSTNIDFSKFSNFIASIKNRLNQIDTDINITCYHKHYYMFDDLLKDNVINEKLQQKVNVVNEAFNQILNRVKKESSYQLNVNTQKGSLNLTPWFFDFEAFQTKLLSLQKVTINKFQDLTL